MAKPTESKVDPKELQERGLRKSVARTLATAAEKASGGKQVPKAVQGLVTDLRKLAVDLEDRLVGGAAGRPSPEGKPAPPRKPAASSRAKTPKRTNARSTRSTAKPTSSRTAAPRARKPKPKSRPKPKPDAGS